MEKEPFDIDVVMARIEASIRPFKKAALFELYEDGFTSPFEQLVACLISIRTLDEVTIPTARRLFAKARDPAHMLELTPGEIDEAIRPATFHERKAVQIRRIAERVVTERGGAMPCELEYLLSLEGVGPK